jgi:hypothetical protein
MVSIRSPRLQALSHVPGKKEKQNAQKRYGDCDKQL